MEWASSEESVLTLGYTMIIAAICSGMLLV